MIGTLSVGTLTEAHKNDCQQEWVNTPLERLSHEHHLCGCGCEWKVKNRKACMVGVVVVMWFIVTHQHHPKHSSLGASQSNTTPQTCVGFSTHGITTERRERVVVCE